MARQLFLHHYFPALYFSILLSCVVFDFVTSTLRPRVRLQIAAVMIIIAIWHFRHFSPLAYGSPWTKTECRNAKWLKTWDFSCNDFLDNYSMYTHVIPATPHKTTQLIASTIGGEAGGRAPVVVQHKQVIEPVAVNENTVVPLGRPEPGRDVFAEQPVKDIKSDAAASKLNNDNAPGEGTEAESQGRGGGEGVDAGGIKVNKDVNIGKTQEEAKEEKAKAKENSSSESPQQSSVESEPETPQSQSQTEQEGATETGSSSESQTGQSQTSAESESTVSNESSGEQSQKTTSSDSAPKEEQSSRGSGDGHTIGPAVEAEVEAEKAAKELYPDAR